MLSFPSQWLGALRGRQKHFKMGLPLKQHLLASAAVVAMIAAGPALAADLPLKAPPPAVAAWSWSGFYIGGHGGYGWGHDSFTDLNDPFFTGKFPGFAVTGFDPKDFLGGLQAGANWQSGKIVTGLEADLSFTNIKGSSTNTPTTTVGLFGITNSGTAASSAAFDLLGSGRARLGYLVTPGVLLYGTGGLAWTRFVQNTSLTSSDFNPLAPPASTQFLSTSTPTWQFGWVAGLGVEARLLDSNWLARLEYLHYDFGNAGSAAGVNLFPLNLTTSRTGGDLTVDVIRAGLSYKFDPDRFALGAAGVWPSAPLYTKAAAPAPWTWSGFYLGAHAGYGWASDPFNNLIPTFNNGLSIAPVNGVGLFGVDSRGFVGGFQAGANWQSGAFVGGLEIDLSGADVKGSTSNVVNAAGTLSQASQADKFDRLGSARVRMGYLVTPSLLLYATGGPGWTRMVTDQETVTTTPGIPTTTTSLVAPNWLFGWTAGLGVEARLWDTNWLARVEYLHYDFGSGASTQFTPAAGGLATATTSGHLTSDVVRAGLSYKFEWPGIGGGPRSAYNAMAAMPPVAAAVWSWSGFYVGANAGYGWGHDPSSNLVTAFESGLGQLPTYLAGPNSNGFVGGFQAGANWQTGSVVGGLEIDLSGSDIKGSSSAAGFDTGGAPVSATQTDKFDLLGSGRARLGYLVSPSIWLYGTGGLAWTRLEQTTTSVNSDGTTITSVPSWRFGWVAGAGGEARLWNTNWLARLEYLHYDFGDSGSSSAGFPTPIFFLTNSTTSRRLTADVVRAGIDYKFD
jgi:opacity protein-like surface antigen